MSEFHIFLIVITAILCGTAIILYPLVMVFRLIERRRQSRSLNRDEDEILRETWEALGRMEDRIENLETILLNRAERERERERHREPL